MKAICKVQRTVSPREAEDLGLYDCFNSSRHQGSETTRELYRGRRLVIQDDGELAPKIPFPSADKVAVQIKPKKGGHEKITDNDYSPIFQGLATERGWYWGKRKGRKKKNGDQMRFRQKRSGIARTFLSLPKWWSEALAESLESGGLTTDQVQEWLAAAATEVGKKFALRTGYEFLCASVHPESRENVHFHVNLGKVNPETHELIGRSAGGEKGRKGFRLLGRVGLNVWRYNEVADLPPKLQTGMKKFFQKSGMEWNKPIDASLYLDGKKGYDDICVGSSLDDFLLKKLPEPLRNRAKELSLEMRDTWVKQTMGQFDEEGTKRRVSDVVRELESVQESFSQSMELVNRQRKSLGEKDVEVEHLSSALEQAQENSKRYTEGNFKALVAENDKLREHVAGLKREQAQGDVNRLKQEKAALKRDKDRLQKENEELSQRIVRVAKRALKNYLSPKAFQRVLAWTGADAAVQMLLEATTKEKREKLAEWAKWIRTAGQPGSSGAGGSAGSGLGK